ncbi:MAG: hypothetical protein WC300_05955 [Candidatus Omnitrophota bacterium]
MKDMKNALVITAGVIFSVMLCAGPVFAAASVSISGGTWAIGVVRAEFVSTSDADAWTVTNDSGGQEDINISVASTGSWTASTDGAQTANQFVLREDDDAGALITSTARLLTTNTDGETYSFGLYFKSPPDGSEEGAHTLTITITATEWTCGQSLIITHTAGSVAPVNKTVTYGTVLTSLTGTSQCWITQNLGAANQPSSGTDITESARGWYWQFNKKQGYKHDGTTRTPSTAWITSISESSNWTTANDPCALLLGPDWRIPTLTEWTNADANGGWNSYTDAYNSVLKLSCPGRLEPASGNFAYGGTHGYYFTTSQNSATDAQVLIVYSLCHMYIYYTKTIAGSVRFVND